MTTILDENINPSQDKCIELELLLRYYELINKPDSNGKNKKWFYSSIEYELKY